MRFKNCTRSEKPKNTSSDYLRFLKEETGDILPVMEAMLTDIKNSLTSFRQTDYERDLETLRVRFVSEGLTFIVKTLPALFDCVLYYIEHSVSVYPGWKLQPGRKYPAFLQRLIAPIYDMPNDPETALYVKHLYQFTYAFKKLKGPFQESVISEQLADFVSVDQELNYLDYDNPFVNRVIKRGKSLCNRILGNIDPFAEENSEMFRPSPGPGATNTPTKNWERFRPNTNYTQLSQVFDSGWWSPPSSPPRKTRYKRVYVGTTALLIPSRNKWDDLRLRKHYNGWKKIPVVESPTSRYASVHKTFGKARGICIEQNETQYFQQAGKNGLVTIIENSPVTSGYVNFTDQSINGSLALLSSSSGEFATLDESDASNRIARELVERLLWDNEQMLKFLLAVSTQTIELPKDNKFVKSFIPCLPVAMFAPMGSAVCFPVMSLVHFVLVHGIIQEFDGGATVENTPVYVYGDDLIIPSRYAELIMEHLPKFGMKMNVAKSYYKGKFRESCGVHAYNGVNVTPIRFKSLVKSRPRFSDAMPLLAAEGSFYAAGYAKTADYLRRLIRRTLGKKVGSLPYVGPKSSILGFVRQDAETYYCKEELNCKVRWNSRYQRYEFYLKEMIPLNEKVVPLSEDEAYLRTLLLHESQGTGRVVGGAYLEEVKIRDRWVPIQAIYGTK